MEQILTIQEERKFIADYIKRQTGAMAKIDDFSGEKKVTFSICDFIDFNSNIGCELKAIVGDSVNPNYSMIINTIVGESDNYELSIIKFFYKNADDNISELSMSDAQIQHSRKFDNIYGLAYEYEVYNIEIKITEEDARALTTKGAVTQIICNDKKTKGNILGTGKTVKGNSSVDVRYFVDMVSIYGENRKIDSSLSRYSDEQIDTIYDYCYQADNRNKTQQKREEKKLEKSRPQKQEKKGQKKEGLIKQANMLEGAISRNVDPRDFNILEMLFVNPVGLSDVKKLNDFCLDNKVKSKNYIWLFSIGENYNKDAILEDIKRCKEEYRKKCSGFLVKCGLVSISKKNMSYNKTTTDFIEDFEKRFPK